MTQSATNRPSPVVITGASSGLGLHAARAVAERSGYRPVLAVRDLERGRALAAELGGDAVGLDLARLASVRAAAHELAERHAPIGALVLNAGVQVTSADRATADGFELTFGVNHLGHFLLTALLRDALAPDARITVVASGTHWGTLRRSGGFPAPQWRDPHELARPRPGSGRVAYATSKLANVLFAYEAARRLAPVAVNAYDPGLMPATGLAREYPPRLRAAYARLAPLTVRLVPFAQHPERSGAALAALAVGAAHLGLTGGYVEVDRVVPSAPPSYDPARAARSGRPARRWSGSRRRWPRVSLAPTRRLR